MTSEKLEIILRFFFIDTLWIYQHSKFVDKIKHIESPMILFEFAWNNDVLGGIVLFVALL